MYRVVVLWTIILLIATPVHAVKRVRLFPIEPGDGGQHTIERGGIESSLITDFEQQESLREILKRLDVIILHFEKITGEIFTETDIE